MRDRRGHGRSGSEQEGGQTRAGEEGNGGHRCFRRTKDMGRVATGQKKRDRRSRAWDGPLFPCPCPGLLGSGHQSASTSVLIVPKCRAGSAVFSIRGLYLRNFLSCFFSFRLKETNSKIALTARLLLNAHLFRPAAPPSSPPSEARRAAGCETRSCWARILAWRAHILTEGFGVNGSASVACPAHGRPAL